MLKNASAKSGDIGANNTSSTNTLLAELMLYAHTHMHAHTHIHTCMHTHTYTHACTHPHTPYG